MPVPRKPYIIGIAGGTCSGKTTMAREIMKQVGPERVAYIAHDSYYKDLSHLAEAERFEVNFDHPDALDTALLIQHLKELQAGRAVEVPKYDFHTCTRLAETQRVEPRDVIIVEGMLVLADETLRSMFDLKIYVDMDADQRLLRRLNRDIIERGRTIESVMKQYRATVRPMHAQFVEPSKRYAEIIVPGEATESGALNVITGQVLSKLEEARRISTLDDLQDIVFRLVSIPQDYAAALRRIIDVAANKMGADSVTLHQYDAARGEFLDPERFSATWPPGGHLQKPREDGASAYVVKHGTKSVSDVDNEPDQELVQTAHIREGGIKAFLGIRLQVGGEILGVLFLNYLTPRDFGPYEQALANLFTVVSSDAILAARSYMGRLAERRVEHLQIVQEIASALEVHADLHTFLQSMLVRLLPRVGAPKGSIQLLNNVTAQLEAYAAVGLERGMNEARIRLSQGITGQAAREKRFVYEPDTLKSSYYLPYLGKTRSEMAAPLLVGDTVLGVLNAEHPEPDVFNEEKQELFRVIAGQAAITIQQKLRLDEEEQKRRDAEQKALVADIAFETQHHIGNKVSIVRLRAIELLEDSISAEQRRKLEIILKSAEAALKASKQLLEIRRPPTPEWIMPDELIGEMLQLVDIAPEIDLQIDLSTDLPKVFVDRDRTAYALKDLITNAQRAILAGGRTPGTIKVVGRLSHDRQFIELLFTNNGPPIPRSKWEDIFRGPGFGLPTARALLQNQSGNIELVSSDEMKTTFVVRLPITSLPQV
jgi:uridine kinase